MIRYLTSGESHGEALIGIVEGMPAGIPVDPHAINDQLKRRWLGFGRGGRSKFEQDTVHIYSGIRFGQTMGSPIALKIANAAYTKDKSDWPNVLAVEATTVDFPKVTLPRPGHADLAGVQKYGFDDIRPVIERSSARETAMRVACCSVARQLLLYFGITVGSRVVNIGPVTDHTSTESFSNRLSELTAIADQSPARMLSAERSSECVDVIKNAKAAGDTLGGSYEVVVTGVPAGLGSYVHWDRKLDSRLAAAIMSVQAQKAVEIGDGFRSSHTPGSEFHDSITLDDEVYSRSSNHAGGIEGGVSNGMPIVVRGYMKPIPTLIKPLDTVDIETGVAQPTRYERSDVTSVPAASVVAESVVAFEIARAILERYGADRGEEIRSRVNSDL